MRRVVAPIFVCVILAACGTDGGQTNDAGSPDSGTCCVSGTPQPGSCGPVEAGGWVALGGGCKQALQFDGRKVKSGTDAHGCLVWVDDGPCDYDAAPACAPVTDISNYAPDTMKPPRPRANACTLQQIADFAACWSGDASKCTASDASACAACLSSQSTDASWGPLVLYGTTPQWNVGGCVDLILGQVSLEPDSCGQAMRDANGCLAFACASCAPYSADADQCENDAAQNICQSYVNATDAPCAVDGGVPDLSACFDDATITDPLARERDFVTRLAGFFCGP
jgi:hypothetical protein